MNTHLSDHLKATRDKLKSRERFGLFLTPCGIRKLVKRFNTFVALAEELEDELHLQELRAHAARRQSAEIVPFPGPPDDGGHAA
ncbi:hypothetical protein [Mycoplana ramosa]|uniref:Uncharacterized protein n=1 Tax=Mycoplana ramosa TaxID=40837 RepID=A0ABW3Z226_MYCRA